MAIPCRVQPGSIVEETYIPQPPSTCRYVSCAGDHVRIGLKPMDKRQRDCKALAENASYWAQSMNGFRKPPEPETESTQTRKVLSGFPSRWRPRENGPYVYNSTACLGNHHLDRDMKINSLQVGLETESHLDHGPVKLLGHLKSNQDFRARGDHSEAGAALAAGRAA